MNYTYKDAIKLYETAPLEELLDRASAIRAEMGKKKLELCSIVNAKSGKCSENCIFCSQSIHYNTDIQEYEFLDDEVILENAKKLEAQGVKRFSLVTSGKGLTETLLKQTVQVFRRLKDETNLALCASLGLLTTEQAEQLKDAGVIRYHHNLEASKEFFPTMCNTHSFQDRIDTIKNAQKAGMEVCAGGIWGIGESWQNRISMACSLRELGVDSIPVNLLMPIEGTPTGKNAPLSFEDVLKMTCIYKILNPGVPIRLCGGRPLLSRPQQLELLNTSLDALMVGNYLTEKGIGLEKDLAFFKENEFVLS